jgi:hypothetical protein
MKLKIYLIKLSNNGEAIWATGGFDRCLPPSAYMDTIDYAAIWTDKQEAESFAEEFGGEVVELETKS